eukprot:1152409-Prymnesium_polylepis.1
MSSKKAPRASASSTLNLRWMISCHSCSGSSLNVTGKNRESSDCESCSRLPLKRPELGFCVAKSRKLLFMRMMRLLSRWSPSSALPPERSFTTSSPESRACSMHCSTVSCARFISSSSSQ